MYTVYKIENSVNKKVYIGITCRTLQARWEEHLSRARQNVRNSRIYAAIRKYGAHSFTKEVIDTCGSDEEVRALEVHYIKEFDSYNSGYNSNLGGHGLLIIPEEIRRKISAAQIGKVISEESKARMSLAKRGDRRCAGNFKEYVSKGAKSPLSKTYLIKLPSGEEKEVTGLRQFCRDENINMACLLTNPSGFTKGYSILKRSTTIP